MSNTLKSYIGGKKKDLSIKSNDGDKQRKLRKANLIYH